MDQNQLFTVEKQMKLNENMKLVCIILIEDVIIARIPKKNEMIFSIDSSLLVTSRFTNTV